MPGFRLGSESRKCRYWMTEEDRKCRLCGQQEESPKYTFKECEVSGKGENDCKEVVEGKREILTELFEIGCKRKRAERLREERRREEENNKESP